MAGSNFNNSEVAERMDHALRSSRKPKDTLEYLKILFALGQKFRFKTYSGGVIGVDPCMLSTSMVQRFRQNLLLLDDDDEAKAYGLMLRTYDMDLQKMQMVVGLNYADAIIRHVAITRKTQEAIGLVQEMSTYEKQVVDIVQQVKSLKISQKELEQFLSEWGKDLDAILEGSQPFLNKTDEIFSNLKQFQEQSDYDLHEMVLECYRNRADFKDDADPFELFQTTDDYERLIETAIRLISTSSGCHYQDEYAIKKLSMIEKICAEMERERDLVKQDVAISERFYANVRASFLLSTGTQKEG